MGRERPEGSGVGRLQTLPALPTARALAQTVLAATDLRQGWEEGLCTRARGRVTRRRQWAPSPRRLRHWAEHSTPPCPCREQGSQRPQRWPCRVTGSGSGSRLGPGPWRELRGRHRSLLRVATNAALTRAALATPPSKERAIADHPRVRCAGGAIA